MIFLIEYNRRAGRLIRFDTFADENRRAAEDARLDLELALHRRGVGHEVVLLDATNEEALRRTHRRYFQSLRQIVESADTTDQPEK